MYQDCISLFFKFRKRVFLLVGLALFNFLLGDSSGLNVLLLPVYFLAWAWLSLGAYEAFLNPQQGPETFNLTRLARFSLFQFAIILAAGVGAALAMLIVLFPALLIVFAILGDSNPDLAEAIVYMLGFISAVVAVLIVLPLIGTMVPAWISHGEIDLKKAIARGRSQHQNIIKVLVRGPGVTSIVSAVLIFINSTLFMTGFWRDLSILNLPGLFLVVSTTVVLAFGEILLAWVFARAFQITDDTPEPDLLH